MKPNVYCAALKTMYASKINPTCTCKLARVEDYGLIHYSFNQAKMNLDKWLAECENEAYCKELFETFQKCKCS